MGGKIIVEKEKSKKGKVYWKIEIKYVASLRDLNWKYKEKLKWSRRGNN